MFTKEELELIQVAIIAYEREHREAFERQKAKGKRGCEWHLSIIEKSIRIKQKIFEMQNNLS